MPAGSLQKALCQDEKVSQEDDADSDQHKAQNRPTDLASVLDWALRPASIVDNTAGDRVQPGGFARIEGIAIEGA